jgi:rhodanese-related sulfurtransferase
LSVRSCRVVPPVWRADTLVFWLKADSEKTGKFSEFAIVTHRQRTWLVGFSFAAKGDEDLSVPEIQAEELKDRLDQGEKLFLLDVRDEYEFEISNIGGHLIPLPQLAKRLGELSASEEIVTVCKHGPRGVKAVEYLLRHGFRNVANLRGGIRAWSDRIDRSVPVY